MNVIFSYDSRNNRENLDSYRNLFEDSFFYFWLALTPISDLISDITRFGYLLKFSDIQLYFKIIKKLKKYVVNNNKKKNYFR